MHTIIVESQVPAPTVEATAFKLDKDYPLTNWHTICIDGEIIEPRRDVHYPLDVIIVPGRRTGYVGKTVTFE